MYEGILFRVFLSLLSLWVVDADQCSGAVSVNPARVVVKYGDSVEANCTALVENYGMGWEATVGNKPVEKDVQRIVWTVDRLSEWEVEATCYIHVIDNQCIKDVDVIVYQDLKYAPTLSVNHIGPMIEGQKYQLQCAIREVAPVRYLNVTWYRGDEVIPSDPLLTNLSSYPPSPSDVTVSLWISPSRQDDGAQFRCEAELSLGEGGPQPPPPGMASQNVGITVHYGPEIMNCPGSIYVSEWENLENVCTAKGNPLPSVTWKRNRVAIDPSDPLSRRDSGVYTVTASGSVKSEKLTIKVYVMYGPEFHCPSNFSVEESRAYNLSCWVEGYPKPDVQWFKEGEEIVLPERLFRDDRGKYHILANSSNGNASHWLDVRVLYPPSKIVELEDMEVDVLGSDVALKCSSTGDPRPEYRWSYFRNENVRVNTEDGVSLLHINGVTELNIGIYTCCAFNPLGEACKRVRLTVRGVQASCHIQFLSAGKSVEKLVVEHGKDVSINCSAQGHNLITWNISQHHNIFIGDTWTKKALTDWNVKPVCTAHFEGRDPCEKQLEVTLFKAPKDLSISFQNHSGPVVKNKNYMLLCEIPNVAPVENLVVTWYKKGLNDSLRTDTFQNNTIVTPQNVFSTLVINATKSENGVQYWCEAKLEVGEQAPRPVKSKPFDVTVHYAPVITLPNVSVVPVFRDYEEVLVCEAEGNPKPDIIWSFNNKSSTGANLTISTEMVGEIICRATNERGTTTKTVQLVFKEDYLPLIAGFVAVVVVIISAIFVFIYSIYYTNTKMGHYSLKDAKPNPQNGDVAQNGLDSNLPVKKLSQQNIYVLGAMP